MVIPDYNGMVPYYDRLSKIVFGNNLERAKSYNLNYIRNGDKVLIVGGGTGSILEPMGQLGLQLKVDFLDVSEKMMNQARKRNQGNFSVNFINRNILTHHETNYDVIITNFFFDQFNKTDCKILLDHLISMLKMNGLLLCADFTQPVLMKDRIIKFMMYSFFRITVNLEKVQLVDCESLLLSHGFEQIATKSITSFIFADVYKKSL